MSKVEKEFKLVRINAPVYQQLDKLRFGWGMTYSEVVSKLLEDAGVDVESIALDRLSK